MSIQVKLCGPNDLKDLIKISTETFYDTFAADNTPKDISDYIERNFTIEKMKNELNNKNSKFFFSYIDGNLAGYIKVNVDDAQSEKMGKDSFEVERIYIKNEFKRRGIGKLLIEKAAKEAQKSGKKNIWLGVWEKNYSALSFYKKLGFVRTGEHVFYMGDDKQTDYIMSKEIIACE